MRKFLTDIIKNKPKPVILSIILCIFLSNHLLSNNFIEISENVYPSYYQDCAIGAKYDNSSISKNMVSTFPIYWGFEIYYQTIDEYKNKMIQDFALINMDVNTETTPYVRAEVFNGGYQGANKTVKLFRNNVEIDQTTVALNPLESTNITFSNIDLLLSEMNELTVSIVSDTLDNENNNNLTKFVYFSNKITCNIQDLELNNVPNVNVSLYNASNMELIAHKLSDINGNVTFIDMFDMEYQMILRPTWLNTQLPIQIVNFTYPSSGEFLTIPTNLTELELKFHDVEGNGVNNISIILNK